MVVGMASKKVTVSLPESQVQRIRQLVEERGAASVSAFVQRAVDMALDDLAGWERNLEELLEATGGPPNSEELVWVEEAFGKPAA